ncbi:MAG: metalloregulator ArsR/SmtB family transcription factor [Streptococcaceae bacterium]|jgi:DNA-binding transcriptional ArsR family regulator|nr:metalloregulator ArsR/SmtB family transcription factor [Streptococcaceae bacterium]
MQIDQEVIRKVQQTFQILSNETRLKIIFYLKEKEQNVSELEAAIGLSQTAISHQLAILRKHNLVCAKKIGRNKYYRLADEHVEWMINTLLIHSTEDLS